MTKNKILNHHIKTLNNKERSISEIINEINNNNVNSTKTNLDTNEVEKLNSDLESFFNNQLSESIN